ncbi:MAG: sulfotransferase domain-containing protein [Candidatus Aminicenantia bacterium]
MLVKHNDVLIRVPDFLIVGAARSGTTTIYSYLSKHPKIFMPKQKEPMFFCAYGQGPFYVDLKTKKKALFIVSELKEYLKLFRSADNTQLIGEASTWYLYHYQLTIQNLKKIYGEKVNDLKIIIILRNPVERAWSHYSLKKRYGEEQLEFEQAIHPETIQHRIDNHLVLGFDYIGIGKYYNQVKAYKENFEHVIILLFEELIENIPGGISEILQFLGVEGLNFYKKEKKLNVSGKPKNKIAAILDKLIFRPNVLKSFLKLFMPFKVRRDLKYSIGHKILTKESLSKKQRQALVDIYKEDILQLGKLIDKDLSNWLQ